MASEGKKVRTEFKKAFDAKDSDKIGQLGKRKNITSIISIDSIVKYMDESVKSKNWTLYYALDNICSKYNRMDLYFSIIEFNSVKLMEQVLIHIVGDVHNKLFYHARDRGRLSIAELIYPYAVKQYNKEIHEIKSYSRFKEFVESNWFIIDEDDMTDDGFILAVISNRNDLVKKILKIGKVDILVRDNFALTYACDYGYCAIVKTLLKHDRSCFYEDDKYAYNLATRRNYVDMVNMIERIMGMLR